MSEKWFENPIRVIPNNETFRDKVGELLFDLIKKNKDFIATFYFDNKEDAVVYDSFDIIEFDMEWVNIIHNNGGFAIFKFDSVICVDVIVSKEIAE